MNVDALTRQLATEEGFRAKPYQDTVGKTSIGYGRNLTDRGITQQEAAVLLANDINLAIRQLSVNLPWWARLDDVRQRVLADMAVNVGIGGLLQFHMMLAAVERGDYDTAADELLNSLWAVQVGPRARVLARMMRTGADAEVQA